MGKPPKCNSLSRPNKGINQGFSALQNPTLLQINLSFEPTDSLHAFGGDAFFPIIIITQPYPCCSEVTKL